MLQPQKVQDYLTHISSQRSPVEDSLKRNIFKYGLWLLGIPAFIYGAMDRGIAAFTRTSLEVTDISYCMIALVVLLAWLFIGIDNDHASPDIGDTEANHSKQSLLDISDYDRSKTNCVAQQSFRLPFPYRCQIYHLLNLKHLEEIHRFSLGNLKITKVSHFQKTQAGGHMRFKTELDSPFNALRLWRQPSVDVDLILHTPYQIELKIPAYGDKEIRVLFGVVPLNEAEHQLFIQMFTDLQWPRELLKATLLLASSLTLLEDLPYLSHLSRREHALAKGAIAGKVSTPGMQLFQRYIDLYSNHWEYCQLEPSD